MRHKWLRMLRCFLLGHPQEMSHVVQRNAFRTIERCSLCEREWVGK